MFNFVKRTLFIRSILVAKFTEAAHFGGGNDEDDRRDRKTVIEELIAESKKRKIEKARDHEEILDLTEKLDSNWRELLPVVGKLHRQEAEHHEPDEYDRLVKEMIFMPRGEPTEKLKNEEDLAKIEKDRLEKLERERLKRMRGEDEDEAVDNQPNHRSADDLDDGYFLEPFVDDTEENKVLSYSINPEDEKNYSDGEQSADVSEDEREEKSESEVKSESLSTKKDFPIESEDEAEEDSESGSEDEESEADSLEDLKADESDEESGKEEVKEVYKVLKISNDDDDVVKEAPKQPEKIQEPAMSKKTLEALEKIPFTIEMPSSYEKLVELLENQSVKIRGVIVDRIIKTNHLRLHFSNRSKMLKLFAYLLQYVNDMFSSIDERNISKHFKTLQELSPLMFDLIQMNPEEGSKCFLEVMKEKYDDYRKNPKRFPRLDTLIFFKLMSSLFPTSDFRHPIATPSFIFLHHILSQSKVKTRSDIASGLFLATLVLDSQQLSKKFLPAVINFLSGVCYLAVKKSMVEKTKTVPPFKQNDDLLVLDKKFSNEIENLTAADFLEGLPIDDDFKVRAINVTVQLIKDFVKLYDDLVGMKYFLDPFETILARLSQQKPLPASLKESIKKTIEFFKNIRSEKKFKFPVPENKVQPMIRMLEPRFETVLSDRRSMYSQAQGEKAEQQKLKHMIKREFKSAKRELRRDNEFLSKVRHKRRQDMDRERKDKVKRIFNEASVQQSEYNALSRTKGRKGKF